MLTLCGHQSSEANGSDLRSQLGLVKDVDNAGCWTSIRSILNIDRRSVAGDGETKLESEDRQCGGCQRGGSPEATITSGRNRRRQPQIENGHWSHWHPELTDSYGVC